MQLSDFHYDLPPELIAQTPLEQRDGSRLLVVHRESGALEHRHFHEIGNYLRRGDTRYAEESYQEALADYLQATQLIQPASENALNDLTEAVFKVGRTALRLEQFQLAEEAYDAGIILLRRYEGNESQLGRARLDLENLLAELPELAPFGGAILEDLDEAE